MKIPLRISTRKLILSKPAIANIKSKAEKLEQIYDHIISCKVMVETPHRHKNHGSLFNVSIDISLPGAELAVKRETNEDVYVAIRDAFDVARRQLLNYNGKRKAKTSRSLAENIYETEIKDIEAIEEDRYYNNSYELDYI